MCLELGLWEGDWTLGIALSNGFTHGWVHSWMCCSEQGPVKTRGSGAASLDDVSLLRLFPVSLPSGCHEVSSWLLPNLSTIFVHYFCLVDWLWAQKKFILHEFVHIGFWVSYDYNCFFLGSLSGSLGHLTPEPVTRNPGIFLPLLFLRHYSTSTTYQGVLPQA